MTDWASIKRDLAVFDWRYIDREGVDDAERFLHNTLFSILRLHIPEWTLHGRKSAHPIVNKRCLLAIRTKNESQGTDEFTAASAACSAILFQEYLLYIKRMRDKLRKEKHCSKGW